MSEVTVENLLGQVSSLPVSEKWRLISILLEQLRRESISANGVQSKAAPTTDPRAVDSGSEHDLDPRRRWIKERSHEYAGEWVALDGDRLIAHGSTAKEVYSAADADGAHRPLVVYVPSAREGSPKPVPLPDPEPNDRWIRKHRHEYAGQWIALDGDRLIAHSTSAEEVFAAADEDGAYLPLLTYIPPADSPPFIGV